jgi:hypothetical protein
VANTTSTIVAVQTEAPFAAGEPVLVADVTDANTLGRLATAGDLLAVTNLDEPAIYILESHHAVIHSTPANITPKSRGLQSARIDNTQSYHPPLTLPAAPWVARTNCCIACPWIRRLPHGSRCGHDRLLRNFGVIATDDQPTACPCHPGTYCVFSAT